MWLLLLVYATADIQCFSPAYIAKWDRVNPGFCRCKEAACDDEDLKGAGASNRMPALTVDQSDGTYCCKMFFAFMSFAEETEWTKKVSPSLCNLRNPNDPTNPRPISKRLAMAQGHQGLAMPVGVDIRVVVFEFDNLLAAATLGANDFNDAEELQAIAAGVDNLFDVFGLVRRAEILARCFGITQEEAEAYVRHVLVDNADPPGNDRLTHIWRLFTTLALDEDILLIIYTFNVYGVQYVWNLMRLAGLEDYVQRFWGLPITSGMRVKKVLGASNQDPFADFVTQVEGMYSPKPGEWIATPSIFTGSQSKAQDLEEAAETGVITSGDSRYEPPSIDQILLIDNNAEAFKADDGAEFSNYCNVNVEIGFNTFLSTEKGVIDLIEFIHQPWDERQWRLLSNKRPGVSTSVASDGVLLEEETSTIYGMSQEVPNGRVTRRESI